tara:strand:- start:3779 stop:4036 length:258 start_codon:yes stop_codon:yes gene_type:complete
MRAAVGDDFIELAAVADFRPEPRQAAADEFGVPRTYADGLELLAATPWNIASGEPVSLLHHPGREHSCNRHNRRDRGDTGYCRAD